MSIPYRRQLVQPAETLSAERQLLEQLLFKLVEARLILVADEALFVTQAIAEVDRRLAENEVVHVNVTGDEVFGFNAGQNVFTLLDTIVTQVTSADSAGMSASIEAIDAALDRVLVGQGKLGTVANRIELAQLRNQADEIGLRTVLSETEDTDLAAAIIELQMQETAYQAAQGALARALQPSLAQFLR